MSEQQASSAGLKSGVDLKWEATVVCTCRDPPGNTHPANEPNDDDDDGTSTAVPDASQDPGIRDWETASAAAIEPTRKRDTRSGRSLPVSGVLSNITPWTPINLADLKATIEAQAEDDMARLRAKPSSLRLRTDPKDCERCGGTSALRMATVSIPLPLFAMYRTDGTTKFYGCAPIPINGEYGNDSISGTGRPIDLYAYVVSGRAESSKWRALHDIDRKPWRGNEHGVNPPPMGYCLLDDREDFKFANNSLEPGEPRTEGSYNLLPICQTISLLDQLGDTSGDCIVFHDNFFNAKREAFEKYRASSRDSQAS